EQSRGIKNSSKWWFLPMLLLLILVNYFGSVFHNRIDLTNDKRYTLTPQVIKMLQGLDEEVRIDLFLEGEMQKDFKKLAGTVDDLLLEFREIAGGKLSYRFISAQQEMEGTGKTYADTLSGLGITPINLTAQVKAGQQSQYIFPVALLHYKDRIMPVTLVETSKSQISENDLNNAEAQLEYKFAYALQKLSQPLKPLIAYSSGNGEPRGAETYDLMTRLENDYELFTLDINTQPVIPDTFKLLIIVKPKIPFTEIAKMRIDQYVMRGGKVIWLIDRLDAEMDSLKIKNQVIAYDRDLNLNDLLFKYGVRINPDLLMDLQCDYLPMDVNGDGQFEFLQWNYFPLFTPVSDHVISKNLSLVAGKFVNTMDTVKAEGVKKIVLLGSSSHSRSISAPALISGEENRNAPQDASFNKQGLIAGLLLEGKFTSLYANRMTKALLDTFASYGNPYQASGSANNKMIVIADGDIALNSMSQGQPLPMGMNPYTVGSQREFSFANGQFIENSIEYMVNSSGLIDAKSKDFVLRLLDKKKTEEDRMKWQLINIVLPVLLVILFAVIYQWWRKRKYG
ncbi:MAG: gliding motility-associated ABC transporter substrate-binding protein GldG, partial [Chitinophagaceae bacterium]